MSTDNSFILSMALFAEKNFELPFHRSIVSSEQVYAHSTLEITRPGVIGDVNFYSATPTKQVKTWTEWTSTNVEYNSFRDYSVFLTTRGIPTYAFGFFNDICSLFIVTNIVDLDHHVQAVNKNEWWLYRFKVMQSMNLTLHPSRLVNKWAKWKTLPAANRFAALESLLFPMTMTNHESRP